MHPRLLKIIFLAYSSLMLLGLSDNVRGPLFPEILREFAVSDTVGSLFFSLSSIFGFIGGLLSERILFRLGALQSLRLSIFLLFISQVFIGFAPSFMLLLGSILIFGFSLGVMGVIQNMMVLQEFPAGPRKNRILAGMHSMYAAASLLAPLMVAAVAGLGAEPAMLWRICFFLCATISLILVGSSFLGPELPDPQPHKPPVKTTSEQTWAPIYFGCIVSSYVLAEILVSSRMALYLRREFSSSLSESSFYTAGFFIALLLSRILFAFWVPPVKLKTQLVASLGGSLICLLVGIYGHPMALVISGLFMGPFYPLMISSVGHLFSNQVSQALSWTIALSSLFVVLMHFTAGYLTDLFGLKLAFLLGPGFCLFSLVLILLYEKIFRRLQHSF